MFHDGTYLTSHSAHRSNFRRRCVELFVHWGRNACRCVGPGITHPWVIPGPTVVSHGYVCYLMQAMGSAVEELKKRHPPVDFKQSLSRPFELTSLICLGTSPGEPDRCSPQEKWSLLAAATVPCGPAAASNSSSLDSTSFSIHGSWNITLRQPLKRGLDGISQLARHAKRYLRYPGCLHGHESPLGCREEF